jgi:hypothetical protein
VKHIQGSVSLAAKCLISKKMALKKPGYQCRTMQLGEIFYSFLCHVDCGHRLQMASPRRSPGQFRRRPLIKVRSGVTSSRGEEVYFTKALWSKFLNYI